MSQREQMMTLLLQKGPQSWQDWTWNEQRKKLLWEALTKGATGGLSG